MDCWSIFLLLACNVVFKGVQFVLVSDNFYSCSQLISKSCSPPLQEKTAEIKCESLDILCDVLHKFGNLMTSDHELLLGALLPQLSSNQASVRKKTVSCIGKIN